PRVPCSASAISLLLSRIHRSRGIGIGSPALPPLPFWEGNPHDAHWFRAGRRTSRTCRDATLPGRDGREPLTPEVTLEGDCRDQPAIVALARLGGATIGV